MKLYILILIIFLVISNALEDIKQGEATQQESENSKDETMTNAQGEGELKSRTKEEIIKERDKLQTLLKTLNYSYQSYKQVNQIKIIKFYQFNYSNDKVDMHITQAEERIWYYIQDFEKAMDQKEDDDDYDDPQLRIFDLGPDGFELYLESVKSLEKIMFFIFISFNFFLGYIAFKKFPKQYEDQKKKRRN